MKPLPNAFEIGYGPSFEVLDHSEVFLDHVHGTPAFSSTILPKLRGRLSADQMHEIGQMTELFGRVQEWVTQDATTQTYQVGSADYAVTWQRPVPRAGVFSILTSGKIAAVSLLICRGDDPDPHGPPIPDFFPLLAFRDALRRAAPAEAESYDHRKFRLVNITRRPLLASIFWPPYSPTEDSVVRTIQLQMAYAFFRLNGELL